MINEDICFFCQIEAYKFRFCHWQSTSMAQWPSWVIYSAKLAMHQVPIPVSPWSHNIYISHTNQASGIFVSSPKNRCQLLVNSTFCLACLFSDNLKWNEIEQWNWTILIFDLVIVVLRVIWWLVQTKIRVEKTLPLILTLAYAFLLFMYCRDYVDIYVNLSKI